MDIGVNVVNQAWQAFFAEIAQWRESARIVDFWWRDDDACRPDPALARLVALANVHAVPLALAVIPADLQAAAFEPVDSLVTLLQHGVDHHNRAAAGGKKTEFPASELLATALERLADGQRRLQTLSASRVLPVLVPPWNRISSPGLIAQLADAGYRGLSTFGARGAMYAAPGVLMVNTHVDVIDWRGSRGFVGEEIALSVATRHLQARRRGLADVGEATGWLTHHAVHDEATWSFMALLLERTRGLDGVRWRAAADLFGPDPV
jgi:hypothetical protein